MSENGRVCKGCDAPLPPNSKGMGPPRIWCSERCRKDHTYAGVCIDCGGPTDGTKSGKDREVKRCRDCAIENQTKAERNERLLAMWEEGISSAEIAKSLGTTQKVVVNWITDQRGRGRPIPRRDLDHADFDTRYRLIATRIREGKTRREIAKEIGTSRDSVEYMIYHARKLGYDMPYRREVAA